MIDQLMEALPGSIITLPDDTIADVRDVSVELMWEYPVVFKRPRLVKQGCKHGVTIEKVNPLTRLSVAQLRDIGQHPLVNCPIGGSVIANGIINLRPVSGDIYVWSNKAPISNARVGDDYLVPPLVYCRYSERGDGFYDVVRVEHG